MCALGNRKNVLFNHLLEEKGIAPYPGSIATLRLLEQLGIPSAIVSSSKNAMTVLRAAGLADRFDVVVDGVVAAAQGLPGKPAPDAFLLGATRLGIEPCLVQRVGEGLDHATGGAPGELRIGIESDDEARLGKHG